MKFHDGTMKNILSLCVVYIHHSESAGFNERAKYMKAVVLLSAAMVYEMHNHTCSLCMWCIIVNAKTFQ